MWDLAQIADGTFSFLSVNCPEIQSIAEFGLILKIYSRYNFAVLDSYLGNSLFRWRDSTNLTQTFGF